MANIIITGSRDFNDLTYLIRTMDIILQKYKKKVSIVSSGRVGAETRGEMYAKINHLNLIKIYPDIKTYGYRGIELANAQMADIGSHVVCFYKPGEPELEKLLYACNKLKVKFIPFSLRLEWIDPDKFLYTYDEI